MAITPLAINASGVFGLSNTQFRVSSFYGAYDVNIFGKGQTKTLRSDNTNDEKELYAVAWTARFVGKSPVAGNGPPMWDEHSIYFVNAATEEQARSIVLTVANENYPEATTITILTARTIHNSVAVAPKGRRYQVSARTMFEVERSSMYANAESENRDRR